MAKGIGEKKFLSKYLGPTKMRTGRGEKFSMEYFIVVRLIHRSIKTRALTSKKNVKRLNEDKECF